VFSFTRRSLYPRGKSPRYPLDRRLGGSQKRSERGGEQKNSQPLTGLEPPDHPARTPAIPDPNIAKKWRKQIYTHFILTVLQFYINLRDAETHELFVSGEMKSSAERSNFLEEHENHDDDDEGEGIWSKSSQQGQ